MFKHNANSSIWAISNFYGPHSARERQSWQELRDFRNSFQGIWYVARDFNLTRFQPERKCLRSQDKDFEESRDIVREFEWVDFPLCDGQYIGPTRETFLLLLSLIDVF